MCVKLNYFKLYVKRNVKLWVNHNKYHLFANGLTQGGQSLICDQGLNTWMNARGRGNISIPDTNELTVTISPWFNSGTHVELLRSLYRNNMYSVVLICASYYVHINYCDIQIPGSITIFNNIRNFVSWIIIVFKIFTSTKVVKSPCN